MWGTFLSEPLPIVAPVGRDPTGKLIGRIPIHGRESFTQTGMPRDEAMGY